MIVMNQPPDGACFACGLKITGHYILWKGNSQIEMHPTCAKNLGMGLIKEVTRLEKYYTSREEIGADVQLLESVMNFKGDKNDSRTSIRNGHSTSLVSAFVSPHDNRCATVADKNDKAQGVNLFKTRGFFK